MRRQFHQASPAGSSPSYSKFAPYSQMTGKLENFLFLMLDKIPLDLDALDIYYECLPRDRLHVLCGMLCCSADFIPIWFSVFTYGADGASEFLSLRLWSSSQGLSGCNDHCAPNYPPLLELSQIFLHYKNLCFAAPRCMFRNLPKQGFTTDYFCFPA